MIYIMCLHKYYLAHANANTNKYSWIFIGKCVCKFTIMKYPNGTACNTRNRMQKQIINGLTLIQLQQQHSYYYYNSIYLLLLLQLFHASFKWGLFLDSPEANVMRAPIHNSQLLILLSLPLFLFLKRVKQLECIHTLTLTFICNSLNS